MADCRNHDAGMGHLPAQLAGGHGLGQRTPISSPGAGALGALAQFLASPQHQGGLPLFHDSPKRLQHQTSGLGSLLGSPVQQFPLNRTNTNTFEDLWRSPGGAGIFSPGVDLLGLGLAGLGSLNSSPLARSFLADPLFSLTPHLGNTPLRGNSLAAGAGVESTTQDILGLLGIALGSSGVFPAVEDAGAGGAGPTAQAHEGVPLPAALALQSAISGLGCMPLPGPDTARALADCSYLTDFSADGMGREELLRALLSPESKVRTAWGMCTATWLYSP